MSEIKQVDSGSIKVGGYIIIDDMACIVKKIDRSSPGKHGHAKFRIEASGIIGGQKKIVVKSSHDKCEVPVIEKKSAQVLNVSGDSANVMDNETYETFDIKIPEELKGKVKEGQQVTYWIILNQKVMMEK